MNGSCSSNRLQWLNTDRWSERSFEFGCREGGLPTKADGREPGKCAVVVATVGEPIGSDTDARPGPRWYPLVGDGHPFQGVAGLAHEAEAAGAVEAESRLGHDAVERLGHGLAVAENLPLAIG